MEIMEILEKIERIEALIVYNNYNKKEIFFNYSLNTMIDPHNNTAVYYTTIDNIINNDNKVYNNDNKEKEVSLEIWFEIISDIYAQLYHISFNKAKEKVIEKLTILEIETFIQKFK